MWMNSPPQPRRFLPEYVLSIVCCDGGDGFSTLGDGITVLGTGLVTLGGGDSMLRTGVTTLGDDGASVCIGGAGIIGGVRGGRGGMVSVVFGLGEGWCLFAVFCTRASVLCCSWPNISASCDMALLDSVPKLAKGVAGAGLRMRWARSSTASLRRSADDVAGIFTKWGGNSTVLLILIAFVLGVYTE